MTVTIGTDPEFFLGDPEGKLLPVCGLLGGTKGDPLDIGAGFGLQEDNVMVEWNMPPCTSPDAFADFSLEGLERVMNFVHTKVPDAIRMPESTAVFPRAALTSEQAMEFGCSPDYDAYERGAPVPTVDPARLMQKNGSALRFAGGHIHLGYDNPNDVPEFVVASLCDVYLGLRAVYSGERQGERRQMYGMPGRFRPTSYGIEYRTLSNYWLGDWDEAYALANAAIRVGFMVQRDVTEVQTMFREMPWNDVRRAIINEDRALAQNLLRHVNNEYGV
jgi:hypothetical protein